MAVDSLGLIKYGLVEVDGGMGCLRLAIRAVRT